jgi:hypothetical protein
MYAARKKVTLLNPSSRAAYLELKDGAASPRARNIVAEADAALGTDEARVQRTCARSQQTDPSPANARHQTAAIRCHGHETAVCVGIGQPSPGSRVPNVADA